MIAYFIIGFIFLTASFFTTLRRRRWWLKILDGVRFHLLTGMAFTLLCGFIFLDFRQPPILAVQLLLGMGVIYHLTAVLPFTPLAKPELKKGETENPIRFLTANVRMSNGQFGRLLSLLEKTSPDLVFLTETNQTWIDSLRILETEYPHTLLQPQDNTYGMALYSRLPFATAEVKFLMENDVPSTHAELLLEDGRGIQFIGLHPRPPAPWTRVENKDLELVRAAGMTNYNRLPTVVSGDLNDVGWSQITRQFKSISGLLDPRIGRGFFNTYNALIPMFRMPIDHFFVSSHFKLKSMKRLGKIGSDHFPVLLEIGL